MVPLTCRALGLVDADKTREACETGGNGMKNLFPPCACSSGVPRRYEIPSPSVVEPFLITPHVALDRLRD
jgi:hypothetical protein